MAAVASIAEANGLQRPQPLWASSPAVTVLSCPMACPMCSAQKDIAMQHGRRPRQRSALSSTIAGRMSAWERSGSGFTTSPGHSAL